MATLEKLSTDLRVIQDVLPQVGNCADPFLALMMRLANSAAKRLARYIKAT